MRGNRDVDADVVTLLDESMLPEWELPTGLTRGALPPSRAEFNWLLPPPRDRIRGRKIPASLKLTPEAFRFSQCGVSECTSAGSKATGLFERMGIKVNPNEYRFGQVARSLKEEIVWADMPENLSR